MTLSDGMMNACYQAVEAVVLAWPEAPVASEGERGLVAIVADDGTVTVEVPEPRGMPGPLMEALQGTVTDLDEPA